MLSTISLCIENEHSDGILRNLSIHPSSQANGGDQTTNYALSRHFLWLYILYLLDIRIESENTHRSDGLDVSPLPN